MASADWSDAEMMIRSNNLIASHLDGMLDEDDAILQLFDKAGKKSPIGAAVRWAIVAGDDGQPAAMFQALPLSEPAITSKPQLRGDSPAVIHVASFPLSCKLFDGKAAAGPVPIIACRQEERLELANDPLCLHKEIQRTAGVLAMPEFLHFKEAITYVKKPQAGHRFFPYKRPPPSPDRSEPRPAKRARTEAPHTSTQPGNA
jgi:hypothetical protein